MKAKAKVNKVAEVANMMVANPKATVTDVMKKFKVSKVYGYNLMSQARTKYLNRRAEALAKPKHRMQASVDTVTGMASKAVAELAYSLSKGRDGKESWKTISVTTGEEPLFGRRGEHLETIEPPADNVNHPAHYKTGGIETIDFIEAKGLNYHLGNVVKYITRADSKGNRKEDLLKAQWYLNREINNLGVSK